MHSRAHPRAPSTTTATTPTSSGCNPSYAAVVLSPTISLSLWHSTPLLPFITEKKEHKTLKVIQELTVDYLQKVYSSPLAFYKKKRKKKCFLSSNEPASVYFLPSFLKFPPLFTISPAKEIKKLLLNQFFQWLRYFSFFNSIQFNWADASAPVDTQLEGEGDGSMRMRRRRRPSSVAKCLAALLSLYKKNKKRKRKGKLTIGNERRRDKRQQTTFMQKQSSEPAAADE